MDAAMDAAMDSVADLTSAMREDILPEIDREGGGEILDAIRRNSRRMEALDDLEAAPGRCGTPRELFEQGA